MNRRSKTGSGLKPCATPIELETLLGYWLGELDEAVETQLEGHLFACAGCSSRLEQLVVYADGIRAAVRSGRIRAVLTPVFLEQLERTGLRIREYLVAPGGTVHCTIAAEDDVVVTRLEAPLAGVTRLDALGSLAIGGSSIERWRLEDLPFDARTNEVLMIPSAAEIKTMPAHTFRVQLLAIDAAGERSLGEYTFEHTPSDRT